jgi:hypothetical protein
MTNVSQSDVDRRRPAPRARLPARRSLGPPVSLETPTTSGIASAIAIAFLLAMLLLRPFTRVSSLDVVETAAPAVVHRGR